MAADSIHLNPYGYTPLAALLNFSTPLVGRTFIRVRGKHGNLTTIDHLFTDTGTSHSVPVIGLYPNYANLVDIRIVDEGGDTLAQSTITILTGDLPPNMPQSITVTRFDETKVATGLILVSNYSTLGTGSPSTPYLMDAYGDIRWVLDYRSHEKLKTLNFDDGIGRLRNGNFFFGDINTSVIYEVDLLGKVINQWGTSGYLFHHEVSEKPDGNFLLTTTKPSSTYANENPAIEDYVIEIDRQDGTISTVWDLKESLDETRYAVSDDGLQGPSDWFHGNAVTYDSTDHTIVVSGRSQGVVKLDYTNHVKWILAAHKGWTTNRRAEDLTQFLLQPLTSNNDPISSMAVIEGTSIAPDFEWPWYQHNPNYMPNGDLLLFDNGSRREFNENATSKYSRVVAYKIDPINKTIKQTWTYGKERGVETFSNIVSSVQYLPQSNHVVFSPGYQVANSDGKGGKIVEIEYATRQVVSEISISSANGWGFHRAKKMSAYP
ncbi:hypothetical protein GCM10027185_45850 [Spirosoma pulveris]